MKFTPIVFGCQMNYADAARIRSMLQYIGWTHVENADDADILIFITCSVRAKSEDKITGKLKEVGKHQKVWITGCMPQHFLRSSKIIKQNPNMPRKVGNFIGNASSTSDIVGWTAKEIKDGKLKAGGCIPVNHAFNPLFYRLHGSFPNVELIFRIDDTGLLPTLAKAIGYDIDIDKTAQYDEYTEIIPEATNMVNNAHIKKSAFVPISTGCSQFCSYCIVPYARGLEKHLDHQQIMKEIHHHLDNGIQEITLLGQIVNKHPHFVQIIQDILNYTSDLQRLRYTSPYPTYYSDELIDLHATQEILCPHIHIPVQSGSNAILKRMHRGYTVEQFKETIDKIHALKRPINITTDIIVGFSGETDQDFQDTLDLIQYAKFGMIYIGKYSVRPGTYGANHLEDDVPRHIKDQRWNTVNALLLDIALENNQKEIGQRKKLIITAHKEGIIKGHTDNLKNITIDISAYTKKDLEHFPVGSFAYTTVTNVESMVLYGKTLHTI